MNEKDCWNCNGELCRYCMEVSDLLGMAFNSVKEICDGVVFESSAKSFRMFHEQDCCESVYLEDVCGDLSDLEASPITLAECVTSAENPPDVSTDVTEYQDDSFTWTFYKIGTIKGVVTLRWYGESNGYYSESVEIEPA